MEDDGIGGVALAGIKDGKGRDLEPSGAWKE